MVQRTSFSRKLDQIFRPSVRHSLQTMKEGKMIAGFKLMYNQVKGPGKTVNGTNLPDGWFQEYLKARMVGIVHLVREAVILHMASDYQTAVDVKQLHLNATNSHHTTDANSAAARRNATMFRLTAGHLPLLQSREKEHKHWLDFLQQTGLPYQYLSYDDLMSSRRDIFVHMVLHVAISGCQGYGVIPKTARPASSDSQSHLWRSNSRFQRSEATYSWDHVWPSMQDSRAHLFFVKAFFGG